MPAPGSSVETCGCALEPFGVVVEGDDGMVSGSPYASDVGDNVPALDTAFGVAALIIASITMLGDAVGAAER